MHESLRFLSMLNMVITEQLGTKLAISRFQDHTSINKCSQLFTSNQWPIMISQDTDRLMDKSLKCHMEVKSTSTMWTDSLTMSQLNQR